MLQRWKRNSDYFLGGFRAIRYTPRGLVPSATAGCRSYPGRMPARSFLTRHLLSNLTRGENPIPWFVSSRKKSSTQLYCWFVKTRTKAGACT
jgi:hypothetical protein